MGHAQGIVGSRAGVVARRYAGDFSSGQRWHSVWRRDRPVGRRASRRRDRWSSRWGLGFAILGAAD
jgi:hypothetical protein